MAHLGRAVRSTGLPLELLMRYLHHTGDQKREPAEVEMWLALAKLSAYKASAQEFSKGLSSSVVF